MNEKQDFSVFIAKSLQIGAAVARKCKIHCLGGIWDDKSTVQQDQMYLTNLYLLGPNKNMIKTLEFFSPYVISKLTQWLGIINIYIYINKKSCKSKFQETQSASNLEGKESKNSRRKKQWSCGKG